MRITIFGASGKVGRQLTKVLLERGHTVTALVHTNTLNLPDSAQLKTIMGDIKNPADVAAAIRGSDIVVSTLGSWGTTSKDIVSTATKNLIPAMEAANIKRFVGVTGGIAKLPGEKLPAVQSLSHSIMGVAAKTILHDADEHLRLLQESTLDWTVIRSPVMTNTNKARYRLSLKPPAPWATISRHAVVLALLFLLENGTFSQQAPFISAR